jgi:methylated-DNA-[protein]-cysteine S-methyltransferase
MVVEFSPRIPKVLHNHRIVRRDDDPILRMGVSQLQEYFDGTRQRFDIPLDLVGTPFQVSVWKTLAKVRFGSTVSYAKEAEMLGRPTAVRAVGSANGRNPVPIIVPCHRVIAADGGLGGFSAGLPKKVWLLNHERDVLAAAKKRPQSLVG